MNENNPPNNGNPASPSNDLAATQAMIRQVCNELAEFLCEKNNAYGNSAMQPIGVFAKRADPLLLIDARIDDKLNRMKNGKPYPGDNDVKDLTGYLILREVAVRLGCDVAPEQGGFKVESVIGFGPAIQSLIATDEGAELIRNIMARKRFANAPSYLACGVAGIQPGEVPATLQGGEEVFAGYTPDWYKAPDWANYWAVDAQGVAWFYEMEPEVTPEQCWDRKIEASRVNAKFRRDLDFDQTTCPRLVELWGKSLQSRPVVFANTGERYEEQELDESEAIPSEETVFWMIQRVEKALGSFGVERTLAKFSTASGNNLPEVYRQPFIELCQKLLDDPGNAHHLLDQTAMRPRPVVFANTGERYDYSAEFPLSALNAGNPVDIVPGSVAFDGKKLNTYDWIEWDGGNCPVDAATVVVLKFRNGVVTETVACRHNWHHADQSGSTALHGRAYDIVAYRLLVPG